jgi:hypothetical protein
MAKRIIVRKSVNMFESVVKKLSDNQKELRFMVVGANNYIHTTGGSNFSDDNIYNVIQRLYGDMMSDMVNKRIFMTVMKDHRRGRGATIALR